MSQEFWTIERTESLRTLWGAGISGATIARQLGCTKNAVVGKAHRLGLKPRPSPVKGRKSGPARVPPRPVRPLTARPCQWLIGHPGENGFHFCDAPALEMRPYCAEHWAKAHTSAPPKRVTAP